MFKNQFIAGLLLIFSFSLSFAQNAGNDQNICSTETQLQGDVPPGGFVGTWTVVTGSGIFADANSNSTQVTNIQKGLNIFRWTYDGNSDDVQVTNNTPTASAGPNRTTCNTSISFSAGIPQTGESGLWEQISGGLSSIAKPSLYNSAVSNLPFGLSQYKWTISNAYCSESDTMTVTSNYVTADAGSDVSSCNGTASILAVNPVPANGLWEVLGAGVIADPSSYSTTISGLSDGNNTMRWTVEYMGCSASDEMTITNTSVIATAGIDQTVCVPEAELAANNPAGTGVWSCPNTSVNIVSPSGYLTSVNNLPPGNTTFRWTVTENSCSSWDQITVTNAEITNADAGPNQTVCGYTTTLNAVPPQGGQIGSWTLVAGAANITDNQIYNTEVTNLSKGVNTFRWKLDNGDCNQTDDVSIINAMPSGAVVSPGEEICTDVYTLTGNNPGTGETGLWSKVGGATGTILSPSNSVSDVTDIQPGANTYRWTISNGTCSDFEELTVTNNSVIANAGTNQAVCGDSFRLEATDPAPASGVWSIETSSGTPVFDNSSLYNTTVRTLGLGQNSLRWHISKGNCSDDDFVSIFNSLPDIADAGADQEVCNPTAVLSANNPSAGAGVWTLMSGSAQIDNSLNFYTAVSGLGIGNTVFRWTISEDGCSNFDEVTINYIQVIADAGKDFGICTTAVNALDGNIPQAGQSGLWTVEGGTGVLANPESYNSAVSNLSAGGNLLTWTITESTCSESDDVSITNNIPTVATVSSNQEICIPETNIYGNQPTLGTGSWSVISGGGIIANTLASNTGVSNIPEGTNIYRWTISHEECTTSADIQVINNETEAITQADFSVCGSDAVIPANEPQGIEYGVWTVISGNGIIENSGNYSTTVSNLSFGSNILQWTMHKGSCSDYDDLKVTNDFFAAVANVAGPTEICTDYTPLIGNIPPAGATGTWTVESGSGSFTDLHNPSATVENLAAGINTIRWTIENVGCTDSDDVIILNNSVDAVAGDDVISCDGSAFITANSLQNGETGFWTLTSGAGIIESSSNNFTNVSGLNPGTNVFRWTVTKGACSDSDQLVVSLNAFTTSAGLPQSVCESTATLHGSDPSPGTGIWSISGSPGVVIEDPTHANTQVSNIPSNSVNTFRWTVTKNGCTAFDEVIITNEQVNSYAGEHQYVCVPHAVMSALTPADGTGSWTQNSGGGTIVEPDNPNTEVTDLPLGENRYTWTVTNGTCVSQDMVSIYYIGLTAEAGVNQEVCSSETTLAAYPPPSGGSGMWHTLAGPGQVENASLFNSGVINMQQGLNTFRWTIYKNGCTDDDVVEVINHSFDVYAGEDQLLPNDVTSTTLEAELPPGGTGFWAIFSGGGTIVDPGDPNTVVNDMITGYNTFQWRVELNGCEATDIVIITVRDFQAFAGENITVCADSAHLNARDEGSNLQDWSVISGTGSFVDESDPKTWVRNVGRGENYYRWTVTINSYTTFDDVMVYNSTFDIYAGDDVQTCEPEFIMNAEQPGAGGTGFWSIAGFGTSGTFNDNTLWNSRVSGLSPGENNYRWEVTRNDCSAADTVTITWNRPPIADFNADFNLVNAPGTATFSNTSESYPEQSDPDLFYWSEGINPFDTTYAVSEPSELYFPDIYDENISYMINMVAVDTQTGCSDTANAVEIYVIYPVGIDDLKEDGISVYPNPAANFLFVNVGENSDVNIKVFDITGKLVINKEYADSEQVVKLEMRDLFSGTYKLRLESETGIYNKTVVIQKK